VKLIVGLGNPGRVYRWTRHNMGFWLVEQLAREYDIDLSRRRLLSVYGRGRIGKEDVVLAKPLTFMNLSGEAVGRLLRFFKVQPEDLILLHDDLDLSWGKIRIRLRGGHGGHQGVKSVIENLGKDCFVRVKVGIGRPAGSSRDPAEFVLQPLTGKEREEFKDEVQRGAQAVEVLLLEGPQEAMQRFHKDNEE